MNTPPDPGQSYGNQGSLFPIPSPDLTGSDRGAPSDEMVLKRLRSFVASIANDASAVTDDPRALHLARDLSEVFADHAGLIGLTKAEAEQALARYGNYDKSFFESRFELFVKMELISPFLAKKHQQRYVLDPSGLAGLLVFERLGTQGGVDEMLLLLDRTRLMLERGDIDRADLVRYLKRCRQLLSVYAAKLARLVGTASITALIEEHRNHDAARVQQDVHSMNRLVSDRFPGDHELGDLAFRLVEAELRYREQMIAAVSRVLDQGGSTLDFSVLSAEQYRNAAQECTLDELAAVGASLVVDPPQPWIDPGALLDAIEEYRPRVHISARPPAPTATAEDDPIGAMRARYERKAYERARRVEDYLQGAPAVELTLTLRALGWPRAGEQLMELLAVSADPDQPFSVELGQMLLLDRDGAVTYMHPVFLKRRQHPGSLGADQASWSDDEQGATR